jgi:hypothetical protein
MKTSEIKIDGLTRLLMAIGLLKFFLLTIAQFSGQRSSNTGEQCSNEKGRLPFILKLRFHLSDASVLGMMNGTLILTEYL